MEFLTFRVKAHQIALEELAVLGKFFLLYGIEHRRFGFCCEPMAIEEVGVA